MVYRTTRFPVTFNDISAIGNLSIANISNKEAQLSLKTRAVFAKASRGFSTNSAESFVIRYDCLSTASQYKLYCSWLPCVLSVRWNKSEQHRSHVANSRRPSRVGNINAYFFRFVCFFKRSATFLISDIIPCILLDDCQKLRVITETFSAKGRRRFCYRRLRLLSARGWPAFVALCIDGSLIEIQRIILRTMFPYMYIT